MCYSCAIFQVRRKQLILRWIGCVESTRCLRPRSGLVRLLMLGAHQRAVLGTVPRPLPMGAPLPHTKLFIPGF